jgi:hypothetical protein
MVVIKMAKFCGSDLQQPWDNFHSIIKNQLFVFLQKTTASNGASNYAGAAHEIQCRPICVS